MAEDKKKENKAPQAEENKASKSSDSKLEAKKEEPTPPKKVEEQKATAESSKKAEEQKPAEESSKKAVESPKAEESKAPKTEDSKLETKKEEPAPSKEAEEQKPTEESNKKVKGNSIELDGLFAFKMSMSTFYSEKGESIPVTALKYEPCRVSQIKTQEKESYNAVQLAFKAQKNKRCSKARITHLKPAGFKEGAQFVREIRQPLPEGIKLGQELSIESLKKGDLVKISSVSKGRGFAGVLKRWNFAGGKASHGSKSHRRIGSIGQHTEPARVMPGRKMPGQYGFKKVSRLKVPVVDVLPEEGIIFVKGAVPGARNTLVSLKKMSGSPS